MLCICDLASIGSFTQQDPIGLGGGANLYGFAGGDPVNFSDPFGLCPPCGGGFEGDPKNVEREVQMVESRSTGDALAMGAIVGAGAVGGLAIMAGTGSLMAAAPLAAASPGVTSKIIGALEKAGPRMSARIDAVAGQLKASNLKGVMSTNAETGVVTIRGGAGARAREIILDPSGSSTVRAFDAAKNTWNTVTNITP